MAAEISVSKGRNKLTVLVAGSNMTLKQSS